MEQRTGSQEPRIEETRNAAEETRASMTEKLEVLEDRVRETLEGTRSTVEGIVEDVRDTVSDTVGTVKETVEQAKSTVDTLVENVKDTVDSTATMVQQSFDIRHQVEQRPWTMFGGAVLAGYLLGNWTLSDSQHRRKYFDQGSSYDGDDNLYAAAMSGGATLDDLEAQKDDGENGYAYPPHVSNTAQEYPRSSAVVYEQPKPQGQSKLGQFHEEWNVLKSVALGTLMGTIQSMVRQQMPSLAPHIDNVFQRMSAKLGTEPIEPSHGQQYPQQGQSDTSEQYAANTPTTAPPSSTSKGIADNPSVGVQPQPYMQYRR